MTESEFKNTVIKFDCIADPTTGESINQEFTTDRFVHVDAEDSSLFKICAMARIKSEQDRKKRVADSVKYQVLIEETAMVGKIL